MRIQLSAQLEQISEQLIAIRGYLSKSIGEAPNPSPIKPKEPEPTKTRRASYGIGALVGAIIGAGLGYLFGEVSGVS